MLYVIFSQDIENSLPLRQQARPAHVERLKALNEQGRLIIAGPCPASDDREDASAGFTGSMVVADFPSLEEAQRWADADPYIEAGVYASSIVKPYTKVLP